MLRRRSWPALVAAVFAISPLMAAAQSGTMFAPDRVGHWYLGGGVGGYWEDSSDQLQHQDGQLGGFFSGGYRLSPNIALEIDGLSSYQRLDTPPGVSSSNTRSRLTSTGVGGVVKFILPMDRVELYAGGGAGIYGTSLWVKNSQFDSEADDTNVGYQGMIGADYYVSRSFSIGLEYRKFKLKADLDPQIPGKIDAGGDFLFATFRGHF
jgi:opacity protein-like surface antigen